MNNVYDISTKEKEISYIELVDNILNKLGFITGNVGTRLLRELIIYIFKKNPIEIIIKKEIKEFLKENRNTKLSEHNYYMRVKYAIENADNQKMKDNFFYAFHTQYNSYYLTPKNFVILMLNVLEKNFFDKS